MIVLQKPLRGSSSMNKKQHQTKGTCAYKTTCSNCGSGDGNQVYVQEDGSFDSWCYACETYDPMNDGGNVVPINQIKVDSKMKMEDVNSLPTLAIKDRGLRKDIVAKFGVKVAVSEVDGETITHHYYPAPRTKLKLKPKLKPKLKLKLKLTQGKARMIRSPRELLFYQRHIQYR